MMEFYSQKSHKARKPHKCEMCGQEIKIGEEYSYESGKYDGEFFERRMHSECSKMLSYILSEAGEYEFEWDNVADWWRENKCPTCKHYYPECVPDDNCTGKPEECDSYRHGKCTDETCSEMTRVCWCEKWESE